MSGGFGSDGRPGRCCSDGIGHSVEDARSGQRRTDHTDGTGCALKKTAPARVPQRRVCKRPFVSVRQCTLLSPKPTTAEAAGRSSGVPCAGRPVRGRPAIRRTSRMLGIPNLTDRILGSPNSGVKTDIETERGSGGRHCRWCGAASEFRPHRSDGVDLAGVRFSFLQMRSSPSCIWFVLVITVPNERKPRRPYDRYGDVPEHLIFAAGQTS